MHNSGYNGEGGGGGGGSRLRSVCAGCEEERRLFVSVGKSKSRVWGLQMIGGGRGWKYCAWKKRGGGGGGGGPSVTQDPAPAPRGRGHDR
jgi:hypothetical protein